MLFTLGLYHYSAASENLDNDATYDPVDPDIPTSYQSIQIVMNDESSSFLGLRPSMNLSYSPEGDLLITSDTGIYKFDVAAISHFKFSTLPGTEEPSVPISVTEINADDENEFFHFDGNNITISTSGNNPIQVNLYTLDGISLKGYSGRETVIDTSGLTPGTYIVRTLRNALKFIKK